jgi:hypothetical protein
MLLLSHLLGIEGGLSGLGVQSTTNPLVMATAVHEREFVLFG